MVKVISLPYSVKDSIWPEKNQEFFPATIYFNLLAESFESSDHSCQSTIRRKTARIDVINQMSGKAGGNLVERMLCHALNFAEA